MMNPHSAATRVRGIFGTASETKLGTNTVTLSSQNVS